MSRWRLVGAGAVVVAIATVVTVALVGDGDGPSSVPTATSSTSAVGTTSSTGVATTALPSSAPSVPAPVGTVRPATTAAPAGCARPAPGSDFDGFGAAEILIENAGGSRRSCVLTADTSAQHQRGLMRQDDLDGYEGMLFRFPTAEEQSFWMRNTRIPLSIAFFDAAGAFVSSADMEPCGDRPDCPTYPSRGPAKFALEVLKGRLPAIGVTPDSRLVA